VGYFEVNQRRGVRWNTSKAFLRPAAGRANLEVVTDTLVTRVLLEAMPGGGLRAVGLELRPAAGGAPRQVRASREVVLAAGAVGTPQLLQLSGIGAGALLHAHGITPRHELPGVGENLQDHLQIRAVFAVEGVKTLNTIANSPWGKAMIGLEYLLRQSGPMSMAPSQLGAFTRSSPEHAWPNVEYHVQPLSLDAFGQPLHRYNAFTASVCNLNPGSRGFVRLASPRPEDAPRIQARYLSTPEDRLVAAESLRLTRRIVAMPALAKYRPREVKPGVQFQSDEELARLAGDIGTTIFHPVGTCRMGPAGDAGAVVDARLRMHGVAGLRVADASIMPTITSGNTNAPTLMIAERAAQWIAEAARSGPAAG
jgi:choline dehydrogenase